MNETKDETKDEIESLNNENLDAENLTPEDLEDVSGGTCQNYVSCGSFS